MDGTFNYAYAKQVMKNKGITAQDIINHLASQGIDVSPHTVKSWFRKDDEKRNNPELPKLKAIADLLEVSVDDLIVGRSVSEATPVKFVPVVGEASCGLPISSSFQEIGRKTPYSGDFWHKDLYSVVACGDSMAPDIEDGDEVVCDPRADVLSGDMVHYKFLGEEAIKIFYDNKDLDAIELIPYNQSPEFKTMSIRRDDENINFIDMAKVVSINKLRINNRSARLRLVGKL